MSLQQDVDDRQIRGIIATAAGRSIPIVLTCQIDQTWLTYRSRFLGLRQDQLWMQHPGPEPDRPEVSLQMDQKIGIAFKQRHYKYIFSTQVQAVADLLLPQGPNVRGVRIAWPLRMQRLQRRAFFRAPVPADRPIFITFWSGGLAREPQGSARDHSCFHGQLSDISAGGLSVRLLGGVEPTFQAGEAIGAHIASDRAGAPLRVDAVFRHRTSDEFGAVLGLQLAGLAETPGGRTTLQRVTQMVSEFQHIEYRRVKRGVSQPT